MNTPSNEQLSDALWVQLFSTPEPPVESSFYDWEIEQKGYENSIELSAGYEQSQSEANKLHLNDNTYTKCSDTSTSFQAVGALALQQSSLEEYKQLSLWRLTPTHRQSLNITSQECQFTQTSETTTPKKENLTSLAVDSRVQAHQTQEPGQDSNTQLPLFGEKDLDVLLKLNPASVLSNNEHLFVPQLMLWEHRRCSKELSNEDFELFLADSLWQDTLGRLRQCRAFGSDRRKTTGKASLSARESLARVIKGSDYLSFPTLTSNAQGTSRPAGQTKCEKWFKDNGLIPNGSQLGTRAMPTASFAIAQVMGFPSSWFEGLTQQYSKNPTTSSLVEPQAELEQGIWQDEPLPQPKQPSPSVESSISTVLLGGEEELLEHKRGERSSLVRELSIPCIVKQLKQPEVKGVIRKDKGDRFLVEIDGKKISVSKLFVYPDFSKSVKQIDKCSSKTITPSTNCSSKTRRHKGEGSGHIYYRIVSRNGKEYQQAYYQWRENGQQRTKYIPKKLLSKVEEAESQKLPIANILVLLGGMGKCSSKSFDTSIAPIEEKVLEDSDECSSKVAPPSKNRRTKGKGSGWIECKPVKRGGKEYKQYWYHYEEWREGDRLNKKSRYIPKRLVARVEKMETDKVSVREILEVLTNKSKRSQK